MGRRLELHNVIASIRQLVFREGARRKRACRCNALSYDLFNERHMRGKDAGDCFRYTKASRSVPKFAGDHNRWPRESLPVDRKEIGSFDWRWT